MAQPLPQAGAIPYRRRKGRFEYLLITSTSGRWIFPKGMIDPGDTPAETAIKESEEEAGARGRLDSDEPLGHYDYEKWGRTRRVSVYLLQVSELEEDWDEAAYRRRQWCRFKQACDLLHLDGQRQLLEMARAVLEA